MRRFVPRSLAALAAGALTIGVFAGPALAAPPLFHEVKVPFSGVLSAPAGELCDFSYQQTYSGMDTFTVLSDGTVQVLEQATDTNINLDTGESLTESISYHYTFFPDGGWQQVGIFWQLRDADGKLVVIHAGNVVFDADFNVVKVTPNATPTDMATWAAVICPALGGNPA